MQAEQLLRFGSYRLDLRNEQLWRGTQTAKLTGKALAVLRYLVERPGQVVSKDELFRTVWVGTVVSDAALTSCLQELRWALHDEARRPRFIETVHRRGFRFIAPLTTGPPVSSSKFQVSRSPTLVGRDVELTRLHGWLEKALNGERQLVFVIGEPGIGKTALVEAFLAQVAAAGATWIGRGQCIEHYGAGEAYLPVLEALGRLCREPDGRRVRATLKQAAPTWLVQMPAVLKAKELEALQRGVAGATKERMLRELAEAMEALTAKRPLVLWLEDLHWCDGSTLDWLAFVARREEPARLLVVGTYRPVDVLVREHPLRGLKQELQTHGDCAELQLDFLSTEEVAEYLTVRFPVGTTGRSSLHDLARAIHRRTDGNPLFMVNMVDYLVARGVLVQSDGRWELKGRVDEMAGGVPENLQQLIEQQIERLSPEAQRLLEVASVAGAEFSAAVVAAGLEAEIDAVEEQCEELARRGHFLRASGTAEWPDGTVAARYGFLHALYQEVLYHRLTARRRQRLHQQIGEREERGYGEQAREIAAELAMHFEQGRDYRRAIQYLQQAGENASRRSAYAEAINLLTKGLELLKTLPDATERTQQELSLQIALGPALMATKGYAASEVERAYGRARELCRQVGETPQLFPVLLGLWRFYNARTEYQPARALAEQLLTLSQSGQDRALLVGAHHALGTTLYFLEEFVPARAQLEQGIALYDPQQHHFLAFLYGQDPGVACRCYASVILWNLGYPDQALKRSQEALALAQELSHPLSLAVALYWAFGVRSLRGEGQAAQERAEALMTLSREQGFPLWLALSTFWRGRVLVEQGQGEEGIAQMHQGLAAYRATGARYGQSVLLLRLAEACGKAGQREEGLNMLAEALAAVHETGEHFSEVELYRLKGELLLTQEGYRPQAIGHREKIAEAEECFFKAIEIARRQSAKSLELRAVMSLARLWQQQDKKENARQMLAEIYNWFTEGFDTKDLQEAKALLEELG
jgi:predicted ATPase/DNA-binding winged helix-turn-helix (wHTH) protein